jgi:hypothetical protein
MFLFTTSPILALVRVSLPVQCVPAAVARLKRRSLGADTLSGIFAKIKNE